MYKFYIIIIVLVVILIVSNYKENFSDYNLNNNNLNNNDLDMGLDYNTNKSIVYNILPTLNNDYLGTIIPNSHSNIGDIIHTKSIESNEWNGPITNSNPEFKTIIVDLSYDIDRKLICIGLQRIEKVTVFMMYKKESEDIKSNWIKIESNENIRSVLYDTDGILLGCHGDNGQIYKKENKDIDSKWVGPINYDHPMKKIIYDKDGILLGIGLIDHRIYKKTGNDWKIKKWDTSNINKERVFDLCHDVDGCLIASTYRGIVKQIENNYLSTFNLISKISNIDESISKNDVIRFKTGLNFEMIELDKGRPKLTNTLSDILKFKEMALNVCQKRNSYSQIANDNLLKINKQKELIDEVSQLISNVRQKM